MTSPGPQVGDDMIVDLALSVLIGARADDLLVRDEDGRCTGLITRSQMTAHHQGHDAERAMRQRALRASPVIGEDGHALGAVVLTR
ncbi:CBS domain-containing protein [Streptomyces sp. NPDC002446]